MSAPGSWSCENALAEASTCRHYGEVAMRDHLIATWWVFRLGNAADGDFSWRRLLPHSRHERLNAHNVRARADLPADIALPRRSGAAGNQGAPSQLSWWSLSQIRQRPQRRHCRHPCRTRIGLCARRRFDADKIIARPDYTHHAFL